jgi:serpin B
MKFAFAVGAAALCASPTVAQIAANPPPDPKEAYAPAKLDAGVRAVVAGMNQFGFALYAKVRSGRGDIVMSPASVSTAFGLAYAGAKGRTAEEIAAVLHYPAVGDFHSSFGALLRTMDLHQNGRTLSVNNAIWLQQGLKVRPEYIALVDRDYRAGLQWVDYKTDPNAARNRINRWVESKTNDRIRNLLTEFDVKKDTRSVLVNTIYFKSDWAAPFDKRDTKQEAFTLESGKQTLRPLMHQHGDYQYVEGPGFKVLAKPYRGGETEMVIFLPDKAGDLAKIERSLDPPMLDRWLAKLDERRTRVVVTIPKFKIEDRFDLKPVLQSMGMRTPLSDASDFSGIKPVNSRSSDPEDWNLKIGAVVHKVFVEVEEKGTEAAAATAVVTIVVTGRRIVQPKTFRADHPFLFLIGDRRTNAILFIGRYTGEK